MSAKRTAARNLAAAFLTGRWTRKGLVKRGAEACGTCDQWLKSLVQSVCTTFGGDASRVEFDALAQFVERSETFRVGWLNAWHHRQLPVGRLFWITPTMAPQPGAPSSWAVPALPTMGALAEWFGVRPGELDWFADCQGRGADTPAGPLRHYTYRWLRQRSGKVRLLEMPKQRLKTLQRRVLHDILDRLPPHDAAHGYRRGRSLRGCLERTASKARRVRGRRPHRASDGSAFQARADLLRRHPRPRRFRASSRIFSSGSCSVAMRDGCVRNGQTSFSRSRWN